MHAIGTAPLTTEVKFWILLFDLFSFFAFTYDDNNWLIILIGIIALWFGGNNLYHLTKTLDYAKAIEELYDRNGGFLWSDEAY